MCDCEKPCRDSTPCAACRLADLPDEVLCALLACADLESQYALRACSRSLRKAANATISTYIVRKSFRAPAELGAYFLERLPMLSSITGLRTLHFTGHCFDLFKHNMHNLDAAWPAALVAAGAALPAVTRFTCVEGWSAEVATALAAGLPALQRISPVFLGRRRTLQAVKLEDQLQVMNLVMCAIKGVVDSLYVDISNLGNSRDMPVVLNIPSMVKIVHRVEMPISSSHCAWAHIPLFDQCTEAVVNLDSRVPVAKLPLHPRVEKLTLKVDAGALDVGPGLTAALASLTSLRRLELFLEDGVNAGALLTCLPPGLPSAELSIKSGHTYYEPPVLDDVEWGSWRVAPGVLVKVSLEFGAAELAPWKAAWRVGAQRLRVEVAGEIDPDALVDELLKKLKQRFRDSGRAGSLDTSIKELQFMCPPYLRAGLDLTALVERCAQLSIAFKDVEWGSRDA